MPKKIRLGILGGGGDSLIGVLHRVAAFINDNYEIVGAVMSYHLPQRVPTPRPHDDGPRDFHDPPH